MSQVVHGKFAQLVKVSEEEMIPAAIIDAQTRDDKDELIMGAGNMVFDPSIGDNGLWVPVSKDNPLEARVRHLEALIGKLDDAKETNPDAASAALLPLLRGLLATLATETTLKAIKESDGIKKIAEAVAVDGLDALATQETLSEVKAALSALGATDAAAETDPEKEATQVAILKGLLTLLGKLSDTVDDGAQKVTLTGHTVTKTLVDSLAITTTSTHAWKLSDVFSRSELLNGQNLTISIRDTHNATTDRFEFLGADNAASFPGYFSGNAARYYAKANEIASGSFLAHYRAFPAGDGGDRVREIPIFRRIMGDLQIVLRFATAPSSGALTISCALE